MKKFLLAFLAVVCLTCLGIAAAACTDSRYYTLYFSSVDGANIVCEIPSGYEVRSGYNVNFKVELDDDAEGEPIVAVNNDVIKADGNGNYSFTMKQDTTVSVSGVYVTGRYAVVFDKGDSEGNEYRVTYKASYVDENGTLTEIDTEDPDGTRVKLGTEVSFSIDVSVYYGENPKFEVLANTQVITPENGTYRTTIDGRVTVSIQGLELEESFLALEDGGNGSATSPFKIRKPVDLYTMAYLMSNSFYYSQVASAYYSLEADIDLKGEEMFIIGVSDSLFFSGDFNGNGHTISNYTILPDVIDQNDFTAGFMSNIGMFGVAAGAQIYDLNLKNFTCDINAAPWDTDDNVDYRGFFVGGVVAYGVGVNITNCTVSGTVQATAGDNRFGYIGGIIGYQMSALMESEGTRYYSAVRSCSTDMTIVGRAGCVYSVGGIAGCVQSYDEATPAMIINCYSTGEVSGAMRTGGIAGIVYSYGAIINSYATGYVDAYTRLADDASYGNYRYAYSGGIVGDLGTDAVVANSFFAGEATATAAAGASFRQAGDIAGHLGMGGANGGEYIHSDNGLVYNCASVNDDSVTINNYYIEYVLGWSSADWTFNNAGYPTINAAEASNEFNITVNLKDGTVGGNSTVVQNVKDEYYPMANWYLPLQGHTIPEFLTSGDGWRTFGYYFDEDLSIKVPNGYVPTHDVTLYACFVNYGEVAGVYYLQWSDIGSGKYIELTADGELIYRDGALSSTSYYYYDGETITLRDTFIAVIDGLSANAYSSFKATVDENGVMTIWDNMYYPANSPVRASKKLENFGYGKYYGAGVEYLFNTDGTGVYTNGNVEQNFTYKVNGNAIEISLSGATVNGTVGNGVVTAVNGVSLTAYDKFAGTWELSAGSHKEYTFDGKGGWSYEYYGYDADGNKVPKASAASGSYTVSGDTVTLNNGTKFSFTAEGYLVSNGSVYYYKQYSYTGVWSDLANMYSIELTFNGVTVDGYGSAYIDYGASYGGYDLEYEVEVGTLSVVTGVNPTTGASIVTTYENKPVIYMYNNDMLIAALVYLENSRTLWGSVYQINTGTTAVKTFYLYDEFKGDWISGNLDVTFNGLGNYNVAGNSTFIGANGVVTVTTADGTVSGTYSLVDNTLTGSFEYDGHTYNISYDENSGTIKITEGSLTLQQRDKWYNVQLIDEAGSVYTFNGKGDIGAGVMTITSTDGTAREVSYNATTITKSGNNFMYGSTVLYVHNGFTGEWYIAGSYGEKLVIGKFDASYTATGTYFDNANLTFTYYPEGNYVTITDPGDPTALPLYINLLDGGDVTELAVSTVNNTFGMYSVCTKGDFDSYKGDYAYDGGTLTLDGFGNSVFTDGAAKYVKNGQTVESYSYTIDEFGQVLLRSDETGWYSIFCEDKDGEYVSGNGKHFAIISPDNLYTISATDENGVVFSFYGNGKGSTDEGTEYTYTIEEQDTTRMQYTLVLTIDGEEITYLLDYSSDFGSAYYTITVAPEEDEEEESGN
ncbi:MAG: hypothetical protein K2J83_06340 [Clostridia bacterium]|nr:hypothetical protein [Clostridia bacterium]